MLSCSAKKRPKDSLLETDLDFDYAGKVPEPITAETTQALDALIKQRIIDEVGIHRLSEFSHVCY